ncbi:hypothetical protein [Bradyrhizobium sp.]|uniref:hypothetical protein n=1 Tax=Bradyrhizobium sp. TaxID=376 RepID=UPI002C795955|nr:hypothetical protein [Bradyrhizobium sp.]HMM90124.1 hypothetical protein [Bradyrhizobium sp.]
MAEIRIDAGKAERLITRMLREEQGMPPADAVRVAASICRRLVVAMPASPSVDHCRIIPREPPDADDFAIAVARKLNEGKSELWKASELWQLVYNQGRRLRLN